MGTSLVFFALLLVVVNYTKVVFGSKKTEEKRGEESRGKKYIEIIF